MVLPRHAWLQRCRTCLLISAILLCNHDSGFTGLALRCRPSLPAKERSRAGRWAELTEEDTDIQAENGDGTSGVPKAAPEDAEGGPALSQRLRQRLASTIAEQEAQVEAVPSEDQKRIVQQEVDLNGIDPAACFFGAAPVAALSYGFWTFTSRSAEWFYNHPVESDFYPVQRLGFVFQAAVVGLSSLAAGIFGFTALGILLLGVRVSFGVMSGELDPSDKSKGIGKRSTAETVLDVFTKDPVEVVKAEKERKLQAELRRKDAAA